MKSYRRLILLTFLLVCVLVATSCNSQEQPSVTGKVSDDWGLIMSGITMTGVGFTLEEYPDMDFLLYFQDIEELNITSPAGFDGPTEFENYVTDKTVKVTYEETESGDLIVTSLEPVEP